MLVIETRDDKLVVVSRQFLLYIHSAAMVGERADYPGLAQQAQLDDGVIVAQCIDRCACCFVPTSLRQIQIQKGEWLEVTAAQRGADYANNLIARRNHDYCTPG